MKKCVSRLLACLGGMLSASLLLTLLLLVMEGRWREAIPLHLCSLAALAAIALSWRKNCGLLDFLWYLGMPGAALALVFPAPAVSRWQTLLNLSYFVTHALIVIIPLLRIFGGLLPRPGKTAKMFAVLGAAALASFAVNRMLGTNFLFLMAPPSPSPLEALYARSLVLYRFSLALMMAVCCRGMDKLASALHACISHE